MKVSELARRAGLSAKAVRFYESEGILPRAARARNGYREYDETDLCLVRLVAALRRLGLTLPESGRLATMCSTGKCDEMSEALEVRLAARRREVAAARIELDHLDAELARLEADLKTGTSQQTFCIGKEDAENASMRLPVRA